MFKAMSLAAIFAVTSLLTGIVRASDFNVDFGNASPTPASSFGAAGSPGFWNVYTGGTQLNWTATNNAMTGVSIAQVGPGFPGAFNDPLTTGNDEALLDDQITSPVTDIYTITGLAAGTYNVYSYTWTFGVLSTGFTVNSQPQQVVGGNWTGTYIQGQTYAFNTVTLAPSQPLIIQVDTIGGTLGAMTGLQIVSSVPSPSCAGPGLAALMTLMGYRRRRCSSR